MSLKPALLIFGLLLFPSSLSYADQHREECELCGMWIDQYMSTRHVITLKDNTTKSFCGIACAAKYLNEHKGRIKDVKVADFLTEELIDAYKAYYLEGSNIPGVMSYISRIAFSTRSKAEEFQKKHGGKIITFEQAFKKQLSNPSSDVGKKPVEVKPRDKCPVCGMFVAKYPKWIAQIIFKDDTYAVFDGAKDMFKYYFNMNKYNPSKRESDIFAIYVTEYYSTNLMEAERLFFVQGSNIYGPMGKELIPIATEKRAMEFLKDHHGKKILRFNEVTMEELK